MINKVIIIFNVLIKNCRDMSVMENKNNVAKHDKLGQIANMCIYMKLAQIANICIPSPKPCSEFNLYIYIFCQEFNLYYYFSIYNKIEDAIRVFKQEKQILFYIFN